MLIIVKTCYKKQAMAYFIPELDHTPLIHLEFLLGILSLKILRMILESFFVKQILVFISNIHCCTSIIFCHYHLASTSKHKLLKTLWFNIIQF